MRVAVVAAVLVAAAAAGAFAATPRPSATITCDDLAPRSPATAMNTTLPNLRIGTLAFWRLARLTDPMAFRRYRSGGAYRIPTYAFLMDATEVTVAARGAAGNASFAFGRARVEATVLRIVPCGAIARASIFAGTVVVPKPGCYTFAVRVGDEVFKRGVALGVARRCG